MADEPWMRSLNRWRRDPIAARSVGDLPATVDAGGVARSLVSAWYGPGRALISNGEVAEAIDAAPTGRVYGLAGADIRRPAEAVGELRRWLAGPGFVGVRIVPWLWDLPPNDHRYYPVYALCVELGVPLCTQIGHTGPLMRSEPGRMIPYLEDVMLDFPDLVVVGGHVGFPWTAKVMTMTVKFENFHVDTSAYALGRLPAEFVDYMRTVGRERTMFGTNWPMLDPVRCLGGLDELGLSQEVAAAFLGGTARRVFRLPPFGGRR